jgi:hypothetical protein
MNSVGRQWRWAALAGLCLVLASCQGRPGLEKLPLQEVTGSVTYKGKPAANLIVYLTPSSSSGVWQRLPMAPRARVQEDGTFTFSTYEKGDGIPAGEYSVFFRWADGHRPADKAEADRFEARYGAEQKKPRKVTIGPETTRLPAFELE